MAIGIGAHASNAATSNTVLATPSRTTQPAGSSFWGAQFTSSSDTTRSIADSKGNGYTQIGSAVAGNAGSTTLRQYYKENGVGGSSHTLTSTSNQGIGPSVWFCEVTGARLVGALHTSNQGQDSTSPYGDAITVTLTKPGLILALFLGSAEQTSTHAEANGFTIIEDVTDGTIFWTGCLAFKLVPPGTYSAAFTETTGLSNGAPFAVAYAVFEEAPSIGRPLITGPGVGPDRMKQFTPAIRSQRTSSSTYSDSIVETGSASDAVSAVLAAVASIIETGSATDAASAVQALVAGIIESGAASDAITAALAAAAALTESGAAGDSLSTTMIAASALSESGSASDSLSAGATTYSASLSESGSASDALTALAVFASSIAETGTATDSTSASLTSSRSITEAAAAADVVSSLAVLASTLTEAVSASDAISSTGSTYTPTLIEAGSLTDVLSSVQQSIAALTEALGATDALSSSAVFTRLLTEAALAVDALSSGGSVGVLIVETASAGSVVSLLSKEFGLGDRLITLDDSDRTIVLALSSRVVTYKRTIQ
jgi:hypothetical protein